MEIEVVIVAWEQACCGASFRVGGEATWQLAADGQHAEGLDRFVHDGHDQRPPDVPHRAVTGTVTAITAISYPSIPIPGTAGSRSSDRSHPQIHVLDAVAARADNEFNEYRVTLNVPDGTDLPAFRSSAAQLAEAEDTARIAAVRRARLSDDLEVWLEAFADDAVRRYADVADSIRAPDRSAVSFQPRLPDAAAVHWMRAEDGDGITVQVGHGRWRFPATVADSAQLADFLDAAVHGWVEERVRPHDAPNRLDTVVVAADGRSWTAIVSFTPFADDGFFAVAGPLWARIQRGDHRYSPWTADASARPT